MIVPSTRSERLAPGTAVKVGVDLGTAYTVLCVLDGMDVPLAASYEFADVVRDGVVTDFIGAVDLVRRLKAEVEARLGVTLGGAHGAFPPGVPESEVRAVRHVIEACDLECSGLVDEPTAANAVLALRDGAVVDVGGGSTGIAVIRDGEVVHTADEATGGTHLSLVVAGALGSAVRGGGGDEEAGVGAEPAVPCRPAGDGEGGHDRRPQHRGTSGPADLAGRGARLRSPGSPTSSPTPPGCRPRPPHRRCS